MASSPIGTIRTSFTQEFATNLSLIMSKVPQPEWVIVSFKEPILWDRSETETWMFNPRRRYILNKAQLPSFEGKIESLSELRNSRFHVQLQANRNLANANILVER